MFKSGDLVKRSDVLLKDREYLFFLKNQITLGERQVGVIIKEDFWSVSRENRPYTREHNFGKRFYKIYVPSEEKIYITDSRHIEKCIKHTTKD